MSFLRDKNNIQLDEGDYVDVRLKVIKVDELGRTLVCRLGGGLLALGTGPAGTNSPDSGKVLTFAPSDVTKVP